jgi:predicted DCC family thiol-disulfide oxidoreductase YuxK
MSDPKAMTAFYDGGCPVCRSEVGHYRRVGGQSVEWLDICSMTDAEIAAVASGKTREDLLGAMHVRDGSRWATGIDAFPAIWARMPGWRRMTWLFRLPGAKPVANVAYRLFLGWQRWHRKRRAAASNRD